MVNTVNYRRVFYDLFQHSDANSGLTKGNSNLTKNKVIKQVISGYPLEWLVHWPLYICCTKHCYGLCLYSAKQVLEVFSAHSNTNFCVLWNTWLACWWDRFVVNKGIPIDFNEISPETQNGKWFKTRLQELGYGDMNWLLFCFLGYTREKGSKQVQLERWWWQVWPSFHFSPKWERAKNERWERIKGERNCSMSDFWAVWDINSYYELYLL